MCLEFNNDTCPLIVIALAGKVGSGVSFVRDKILQALKTYKYETDVIDVSDAFLDVFYQKYSLETELNLLEEMEKSERTKELQRRGNFLRNKYGPDFIARLTFKEFVAPDTLENLANRKAYVIDSLKNPGEAEYLRRVFGSAFFLVAVVADDSVRRNRLIERKNFSIDDFDAISSRDSGEEEDYGQNVTDTILGADYFFENNYDTKNEIFNEAERFLRLVFRASLDTPRSDETGMMMAFSAALESACLSRQVGAAIVSESGTLIVTGRNDVPKFSGGLYTNESQFGDKRCWVYGAKCYNDDEKIKIIEKIIDGVQKDIGELTIKEEEKDAFEKILRRNLQSSRVKKLLEFSRSIHAEMDAILAVARENIGGIKNSTLYCTTYPCHNCAKHIVGVGIKRVVFLEPYEKSLARHLHADSIADPGQDRTSSKLLIEHFTGASPKRYSDFFSTHAVERKCKSTGVFLDNDRKRIELTPVGANSLSEMKARLDLFRSNEQSTLEVENEERSRENDKHEV